MITGYADPFETLFAFQRALENRFSRDWLGSTTRYGHLSARELIRAD
jgi:hypothetical protein